MLPLLIFQSSGWDDVLRQPDVVLLMKRVQKSRRAFGVGEVRKTKARRNDVWWKSVRFLPQQICRDTSLGMVDNSP